MKRFVNVVLYSCTQRSGTPQDHSTVYCRENTVKWYSTVVLLSEGT